MEITDKQKAFLVKHNVAVSGLMSREKASELINEIINKPKMNGKVILEPETVTVEKVGTWKEKPKFDTSLYYAAYAKDLCIAMLQAHVQKSLADKQIKPVGVDELMQTAVFCIKMAQKEFQ